MEEKYVKCLLKILKKIRLEKNFSQEQFAFELNISTSYFGMIERGERKLTFHIFLKIAKILGVSPSELLKIVEEKNFRD